jgi:thioredoxin reductase (NADPH)
MTARHARLIIIGSGPAGYTAAIYAARAMLEPLVIEGIQPGGQLTITTDVENYPGFAEPIQGPWLMEQMRAQAIHCGAEIVSDFVSAVDFSTRPFKLKADSGDEFTADAVVIATGAQARWLGIPSEEKFKGFGVSACATCDGFFYRGKEVMVIGGGNSAVEEAIYLAQIASKVTIVHRRNEFRSEKIMRDRLLANPKVKVLWDTTVEEIVGTDAPPSVTGARLRNVKTGEIFDHAAHGIFIAIGHSPATAIFAGQIDMKPNGYIKIVSGSTATNVPGIFAAGDVADETYRQAVTAAGMGCMAALDVERYLAH